MARDEEDLAVLYLATIQALAVPTKYFPSLLFTLTK